MSISATCSRRGFLKAGIGLFTAAALEPELLPHQVLAASAPPPDVACLPTVQGYCPFCQTRCTYDAFIRDGKAVHISGKSGSRWTGGTMCPKGMSIIELAQSPYRLKEPMVKTEAGWKTISYDEAIAMVAEKLKGAMEKWGKDIGAHLALTSPLWDCRESELAALMTMRLAGGLYVMPPGEACISTASSSLNTLFGSGNSTTTVDELPNAALLLLWGANLAETYPPYVRWLDKARDKGVQIVCVDCRKTPTGNWASTIVMPRPGTDGALALGTVRHLFETGAYDADYVAENTKNVEVLRTNAEQWTVEAVAEVTGLSPDTIRGFYARIAESPRTMMWLGGSLSRYSNGMATIRSIVSMQVMRNQIMGSGQGLLTMESGKPEGEKEFVDHVCGPAKGTGGNFRRLRMAMEKGEIDLLFLNSSYRRYPDCANVAKAIQKCGFVVHRGFFKTEELDVANLFVPATFSLESQGSHYGAEKQVVWRDQCQKAPGSCVPDWRFYRDIGRKLFPGKYPDFEDPEALCTLFSNTLPDWKGITVERLRKSPGGLVGPIPEIDGPEQLGCIFPDKKFRTADGLFDFAPPTLGNIEYLLPRGNPAGKEKNEKYLLTFIQGKVVTQWQQTMTNFAPSLAQFSSGRTVQIHPDTAKEYQVADGDEVMLETQFGKLPARVEISESILPGVVFTPSHFAGTSPNPGTRAQPINSILPNYWDRISAQFNGIGCTLTRRS